MSYACVRVKRIGSIQAMRSCDEHGRRLDDASASRVDPSRTKRNLAWSCVADPLAVVDAFRHRKAEAAATEYKGAALGLHILCTVSPEWVSSAGDLHDPGNDRNKALFQAARDWGEKIFGAGSVIASRMDMDEAGGGVVDIFVVPVHQVKQRGKTKNQISVNKAFEAAFGGGRVYSKMQDSWAEHVQKCLDPEIKRGIPKSETGRSHVHADIYRPMVRAAEKKSLAVIRGAKQEAAEIKAKARADAADAVEAWKSVKGVPWRDRKKVVEVAVKAASADAFEKGRREGNAETRKQAISEMEKQKRAADDDKAQALEAQKRVADEAVRRALAENNAAWEVRTLQDREAADEARDVAASLKVAMSELNDLRVFKRSSVDALSGASEQISELLEIKYERAKGSGVPADFASLSATCKVAATVSASAGGLLDNLKSQVRTIVSSVRSCAESMFREFFGWCRPVFPEFFKGADYRSQPLDKMMGILSGKAAGLSR